MRPGGGPVVAQLTNVELVTGMHPFSRSGWMYRASDLKLDRPVALVTFADLTDPEDRERFRHEARLLAHLSTHPGVVTVFDAGFDEDTPYLIAEPMDGPSLAGLVAEQGPLPWAEATDIALQLCAGLGQAHQGGLLHRHLEPGQVLMVGAAPKLAPFGLSVADRAAGPSSSTPPPASASAAERAVLHRAPETFEDQWDARSDCYSLTSLLFHLIEGSAPFQRPGDDSEAAVRLRLLHDEAPPLDPELVPPALAMFVAAGLSKDPLDRPQTTDEFAHELRLIREGRITGSTPSVLHGTTGTVQLVHPGVAAAGGVGAQAAAGTSTPGAAPDGPTVVDLPPLTPTAESPPTAPPAPVTPSAELPPTAPPPPQALPAAELAPIAPPAPQALPAAPAATVTVGPGVHAGPIAAPDAPSALAGSVEIDTLVDPSLDTPHEAPLQTLPPAPPASPPPPSPRAAADLHPPPHVAGAVDATAHFDSPMADPLPEAHGDHDEWAPTAEAGPDGPQARFSPAFIAAFAMIAIGLVGLLAAIAVSQFGGDEEPAAPVLPAADDPFSVETDAGASTTLAVGETAMEDGEDAAASTTVTTEAAAMMEETTTTTVPRVLVPSVIGFDLEAATRLLRDSDFEVVVVSRKTPNAEPGKVADQKPDPGDLVALPRTVTLYIPRTSTLPVMIGRPADTVCVELQALGLRCDRQFLNSDQVPTGNVILANPPGGSEYSEGSGVQIVVSKGPVMQVALPAVTGLTQEEAEASLIGAGFSVISFGAEPSASIGVNLATRTEPAAGTVLGTDEPVVILLSTGPPPRLVVPNLMGLAEAEASARLTSLGLSVAVAGRDLPTGDPGIGNVVAMDPVPGTQVDGASTVTITVGREGTPTTTMATTTTTMPASTAPDTTMPAEEMTTTSAG